MDAENTNDVKRLKHKRIKLFRRIHVRTAFLSWLVSIATVLIFALYVIPQQKHIYLDVMESKAHVLASSIRDVAASSVVTEDYSEVVDHCMEIVGENESISFLVLTRNDGFSLLHKQDGWRIEQMEGEWRTGINNQDEFGGIRGNQLVEGETYQYSSRFNYSGMNWGWIHIGLSLDQYDQAVRSIFQRTVYVALFCIVIGLVASFLYAGRLVRPILALEAFVKKVAGGDLEVRANIQTGDEVESLAESFNEMTADICKTHEELVAAKEGAETASEAKSRFLANMSHEIRTPLNGVVGMLKLLRESPLSSKQRRFVNKGILSSEALLVVINDVLDFSKIEAGKLEIEHVPFNLICNVEDVVQIFAQSAEEKKLELACSINQNVPAFVMGDPCRITQVLINLLSNAIKFTEQGSVVVRAGLESEEAGSAIVRFEVVDSGKGISDGDVDRIFEPFLQEDVSTTRQFGGTGLGLGICRQLVELMGGKIGVESQLGDGSRFSFTVLLGTTVEDSEGPRFINSLRDLRVLVVDDHPVSREIIREELEAWDAHAEEAESGDSALALMQQCAAEGKAFDLAIIDWNMPGMDGEELGRQIKADPALADTHLIMLGSVYAKLKSSEFSASLTKPARQSELYDAIMNVINGVLVEDSPPVSETKSAPANAGSIRILLAEDNEINQEVACEILDASGYSCDIVNNGRLAVEAATDRDYDIIFMDCMMPEMDGYEATRKIRENESALSKTVPIIALTANAMKGDREVCLSAGMDDYLSKPLDPELMVGMINEWVSGKGDELEAMPSEASATDELAVFERETVLQRCMGNEELLERLIIKFFEQADADVVQLGIALSAGQAEKAMQLAHRIKGAAANLSMEQLRATALSVETHARNQNLNDATDEFSALEPALERVKAYLATEQKESSL